MKKYNLSAIMKRAWTIKKEDSKNIFPACLKMAWAEAHTQAETAAAKEITPEDIKALAEKYAEENCQQDNNWFASVSCSAWVKHSYNRTYISIKEYHKGQMRNEIKCGYWDNQTDTYETNIRNAKVVDLLHFAGLR